jgi:hypothetical protein
MIVIILRLLKATAQLIVDTQPEPYDHATSALLTAMADYVRHHGGSDV